MRIIQKPYKKWDKKIKRRLIYATFENGFMRKAIRFEPNTDTFVAFNSKGYVMGWAIAFQGPNEIAVNIFVNFRFREKGIAKILIKKILKKYRHIVLFKWDEITYHLFPKIRKEFPEQIKIKSWYPHNKKKYFIFVAKKP